MLKKTKYYKSIIFKSTMIQKQPSKNMMAQKMMRGFSKEVEHYIKKYLTS